MDTIPHTLLHGSRSKHLDRLSSSHGLEQAPFGPALYLTEDSEVARSYTGQSGGIYAVELAGNSQLTIPMNGTWKDLSVDARLAIQRLFKAAHMPMPGEAQTARSILDSVCPVLGLRKRNAFLSSQGIWMLYGHIDASENADLSDQGVHYALISDTVIISQQHWESECVAV